MYWRRPFGYLGAWIVQKLLGDSEWVVQLYTLTARVPTQLIFYDTHDYILEFSDGLGDKPPRILLKSQIGWSVGGLRDIILNIGELTTLLLVSSVPTFNLTMLGILFGLVSSCLKFIHMHLCSKTIAFHLKITYLALLCD